MDNEVVRTRRELSSDEKVTVIQHLHPFLRKDKLQRGAYKHVAEQLNLDPRTVGYIWRTFRDRGTTATKKKGKVGPKRAYTAEYVQQLVQAVPVDQRSTFSDLAAATRLSPATLNRHLKKGTLERRSTRIKLLLTDSNKEERKWFNADKDRRKVYLVPGEAPPRRSWKSKRFIPKVMFLGAVARPRINGDRSVVFNGKIGMWPFVRLVPALRNSRNRPAGTMVTKLVNVDAAVYRDFVINKVVPAIKASFPSATKRVLLQHDNATPHGSITDAVLESVSTDGWTFKMRKQPSNSPDLNVLDLGFFASIQSLQYKKMSRTVDDVVRNTMEVFDELTYDKLESVFLTFQTVMRLVLEHSGDSHFALPHLKKAALRRAGLLMSNVSCPVSLIL
ncbi:hypothetical protein H257_02939 [Aphanomyces astaci]|uniref:Transposase Tc1-like domain-containing protein n=1 Tax=Aphanomyces astaci TaxID=112090 RepID=W4GZK3_APHAT|nr:hypothetical protein H257_02939 [Aphanomyces astaci]ETV85062.1 hypothetical protein H257_02939 [Aphanomyces astaci]|eukprot:XP_009825080.1 hypothetical protein H257_02939 [Aphanomyces astaci]